MKKVLIALTIISVMFLSGCVTKKTGGALSVDGNGNVKVDYKFLSAMPAETVSIKGEFFAFKVPKSDKYSEQVNELFGVKGQFASIKIGETSGYPIVKITAHASDVDIISEQNSLVKEIIGEISGSPTVFGDGEIELALEQSNAKYRGIDVVAKDGTKYTVLTGLIAKTIKIENNTKDKALIYVVSTIIKNKNVADVTLFETVVKTLEMKEQNIIETSTPDGDIEVEGNKVFDALRNSSGAETINKSLSDVYTYIEKFYGEALGITAFTATEEKLSKILDKAKIIAQNHDDIITKKILEVNVEWEKKLEGQVKKLGDALDGVRPTGSIANGWIFSTTYAGSGLDTAAQATETILANFIKARREKNILNKTDGSEYYIIYEELNASLGSIENLFYKAVKDLVIAYTIELVCDYSNDSTVNVDRQGEGRYKQFQKILKWKNALVRNKSNVYDVYREGEAGIIAREYIDKKGINSLYNRLDDSDIVYYKEKANATAQEILEFNAMKVAFLDNIEDGVMNSADQLLYDYADYFNIRAGRFENRYSEKGDNVEQTIEPTQKNTYMLVYGFDGTEETFKTYMYMIKMFANSIVPNLDINNEQTWEETKDMVKASANVTAKSQVTRYENVISNYNTLTAQ